MSQNSFNNDNINEHWAKAKAADAQKSEPGVNSREYKAVRQRRDGKTGCLGGVMYFVFILSVSIILACLGWMAASDVLALNKEEKTTAVVLPETIFTDKEKTIVGDDGETTRTITIQVADMGEVAQILKDAGIIQYKSLFRFYSAISDADEKVDPGTYELSTLYDYRAVVKKMQFGSSSQVKDMITFPEGFTMKQIFERLEEKRICKVSELMDCAANVDFGYRFLEDVPLGDASRLEGFLYPDTYEFYQGMTPEAAIDTFLQIFHYKLTAEMWDIAAAKGYTMHQMMTIASMIEAEAANDDERANIASVIYNRLAKNMPLQIDATIQYILPERKENLSIEDTQIDNPYNTYKNTGLPPAPICNPGTPSINAAMKPAATNYLYYALDTATNTHKFFNTYEEHQAFVATQNYG